MKIRKIGRERPLLYRGKFNIPGPIISRLAISYNHLILAQISYFNAKVDQYYLAIDNALSAVIIAKEGTLSTTDHQKKIIKFLKHLQRRARIRSITQEDFDKFHNLWSKSRYDLFFPSISEIYEMRLFTSHLYWFAVTEIARFFKSDEKILASEIEKLLEVYESNAILEESSHIHEYHQMKAEEYGERFGGKLVLKMLNPWNYINISLVSDRNEIIEIVDLSKDIHDVLTDSLNSWDKLISKITMKNLERITLEIANNKMAKKKISQKLAIKEALEQASKHPDVLGFRLVLNLSYDSMGAKEELTRFSKLISTSIRRDEHQHRAFVSGWENNKIELKK